jgi:RHS repeat-associated protein
VIAGLSTQKENSLGNLWTFQGQERQDALDLGWYGYKWRNHQPELGRFFNVDPLSEDYKYNSTFAFSENKVTNSIELEGLESLDLNIFHSSRIDPYEYSMAYSIQSGIDGFQNIFWNSMNFWNLDNSLVESFGANNGYDLSIFNDLGLDANDFLKINRIDGKLTLTGHDNTYSGYLAETFGNSLMASSIVSPGKVSGFMAKTNGLNYVGRKLKDAWGKLPPGWELHHIFPEGLADHKALKNYNVQDFFNGIPLSKYSPARGLFGQHAKHTQYTIYVEKRLNEFIGLSDFKLKQSINNLRKELIGHISNANKMDDKRINEYFRELLK